MFDPGRDTAFNHRVLDAIQARSKAVLHNLANKNTPGYKRLTVSFEGELRRALDEGRDVATVQPRVSRDESGSPGVNNVNEFDELATLQKLQSLHTVFSRAVGGYFQKINKAISGR